MRHTTCLLMTLKRGPGSLQHSVGACQQCMWHKPLACCLAVMNPIDMDKLWMGARHRASPKQLQRGDAQPGSPPPFPSVSRGPESRGALDAHNLNPSDKPLLLLSVCRMKGCCCGMLLPVHAGCWHRAAMPCHPAAGFLDLLERPSLVAWEAAATTEQQSSLALHVEGPSSTVVHCTQGFLSRRRTRRAARARRCLNRRRSSLPDSRRTWAWSCESCPLLLGSPQPPRGPASHGAGPGTAAL